MTIAAIEPTYNFVIANPEPIVTIKADGTMEFGKNYHPDEAAKIFWDAVARINPYRKNP